MKQTIYFDADDTDIDGYGWNVVQDGGSIAARFATKEDAIAWCERRQFPFDLINGECDRCEAVFVIGADDHCGECGSCRDCCGGC